MLKQASEEHARQVAEIQGEIDAAYTKLRELESRLAAEKTKAATDYNESIPTHGELKAETSRADLDSLSNARSKKSTAIRSFEHDLAKVIRPIEQLIANVRSQCRSMESRLVALRAGYSQALFAALPASPAKMVLTDLDGSASIALPRTEPWYLWAVASREVRGLGSKSYEWLLVSPDDLDGSGKLFFDHRNLLANRECRLEKATGYLHMNSRNQESLE